VAAVWDHRDVGAFGGLATLAAIGFLAVSCGADATEDAFIAHPRLECLDGEGQNNPPSNYDTDQPGAATAEDVLRPMLDAAAGPDQQVVKVSDAEYGLSTDGRIVDIVRASETRPGEWHFVDEYFCG
jgi:hypothetical protein